jgi:hypothetical protein
MVLGIDAVETIADPLKTIPPRAGCGVWGVGAEEAGG